MKTTQMLLNRWTMGYVTILVMSLIFAFLISIKSNTDYQAALVAYKARSTNESKIAASELQRTIDFIYQGLRAVSMLPAIQNINGKGANLTPDALEAVHHIYNNMHANVGVSEIYVTSVSFDPDGVNGPKEPIIAFDAYSHAHQDGIAEIEDDEYRLIRKQLDYLKSSHPHNIDKGNERIPMIGGPSVTTCDNTFFAATRKEADRQGLVFSMPFYNSHGDLHGVVSIIVLNNALMSKLSDPNHVLINTPYNYKLALPNAPGTLLSNPWLQKGEVDNDMLFSTVIPLKSNDIQSAWSLWIGYPDDKFLKSSEIRTITQFRTVGYWIVFLLALTAAIVWALQRRSFQTINNLNLSLERKVSERTQELVALASDLEKNLDNANEANLAKSNFLANMSHELRTPMNGVLGMSYLLGQTRLSEEQTNLVSVINSSAEGLLMLLNDILDFSKIEAGALKLENIAYDLRDVFEKTMALLKTQANAKGLEFNLSYDGNLPDYVWGDPNRLRQVITNLLGNALKFTQKGHVNLCACIKSPDGHSQLFVSVEDTGVGIAASKLERIFEKFTQGDESISRTYGGTGLGLTISKHLVEMMEGSIGVQSTEGQGSVFSFTIPLRAAEISDLVVTAEYIDELQPHKELKPISEARVLLAEDYHINAIFAEKLLRRFGVQSIDFAVDGLEAIKKYQEKNYDLILMDCQMPELDGYNATQEIRHVESTDGRYTPIVAMTANAMVGDREKCLNAGMDDYVSKPIRIPHLQQALKRWFAFDAELSVKPVEKSVAPLDLSQLDSFTNGDEKEKLELFELFIDQTESVIHRLTEKTDEAHEHEWKLLTHRLKGSAANLGACPLQELCAQAEEHFMDAKHKKLEMLTLIKVEYDRLKDFMRSAA